MVNGGSEAKKRKLFEEQAMPHADRVYAAARHLARNPDDASDLLQETMLRGFRFFDQFTPGTNCRAWLMTILYNTFRNGYRRASYVHVSSSSEEYERALEAHSLASPRSGDNPECITLEKVMDEQVEAALNGLADDFREVLTLVDIGELSYEEAALALKVPIGTVRSRLSRARAVLRRSLLKFARAQGYTTR
jgi:RNA polymerase sigma-70 factor (ECF subfamily)